MYGKLQAKLSANESKYLSNSSKQILVCFNTFVYFFVLVSIWSILLRLLSYAIMTAWELLSYNYIKGPNGVEKSKYCKTQPAYL